MIIEKITYKGREVNLTGEWRYNNEKANGKGYEGLVLFDNGSLCEVVIDLHVAHNWQSTVLYTPAIYFSHIEIPIHDEALIEEAKRKLEINWRKPLTTVNDWTGMLATGAEYAPGMLRLIGYNTEIAGKLAKTANTISRWGRAVGPWTGIIGIGLDGLGLAIYLGVDKKSPNAVSPYKFALNAGITAYGVFVPGGAFIAIGYFAIDTFYPGGWRGALETSAQLQRENQKIMPGFNLYQKQY